VFERVIRALVAICAAYYTIVGAMLFATPEFFSQHTGAIGPYNPHYERDAASFILPLGIALFFAAANPARYRAILVVAAAASVLHAASHAISGATIGELLVFAAVAVVLALPLLGRSVREGAQRA
jgi:hypothetical protein